MGIGPVVGVSVGTGIVPTGAGTPRNALSNIPVRVANASPGLFILPKFNPSTVAPTPNPLNGHIFPVQPLPGSGGGGGGPVGYPIDSG